MVQDSVQHWNFALLVLNLQILLPESQLITNDFRKIGCECRRWIELSNWQALILAVLLILGLIYVQPQKHILLSFAHWFPFIKSK